jgi:hypothetical protein
MLMTMPTNHPIGVAVVLLLLLMLLLPARRLSAASVPPAQKKKKTCSREITQHTLHFIDQSRERERERDVYVYNKKSFFFVFQFWVFRGRLGMTCKTIKINRSSFLIVSFSIKLSVTQKKNKKTGGLFVFSAFV